MFINSLFTRKILHYRLAMSEKMRKYEPIWITRNTFSELLQIANYFAKNDSKTRNPDEVIKELVVFWKNNHKKTH